MTIWLIRAGAHGEYEQRFLQNNRVYLTWDHLAHDLSTLKNREQLFQLMEETYPDRKTATIQNWVNQVWSFVRDIKQGDAVVLPLKTQPTIYVGEITGDYHFEAAGPDPFFHWRTVKWIGEAIPRTNFGKDLLYSFGASQTICRIQRNKAEARLLAMRANGWKPETLVSSNFVPTSDASSNAAEVSRDTDLEQLAQDQIAQMIAARFTGHGLTRLVDAVLRALGYTTYLSPEGADGGADILAGSGDFGFGAPRLCVQVKSDSNPTDRPTVDKLLGAMTKFDAREGLFVSWTGFKGTVQKELAPSFFRVRLWSRNELLAQLFASYDRLDEDIKAELPLKRIWTVAVQGDE
jgi:restriction system protein